MSDAPPSHHDAPPLARGDWIAPDLRVVGLRHRGTDTDIYDAWCDRRWTNVFAKVVRAGDADGVAATRALVEGRLLRRIGHPNIVRCLDLHEAGATDGNETVSAPVVVLDKLAGSSLHTWVHATGQRVSWTDLAAWTMQLASALAYVHREGMLHLDVKPGNIVIAPQGAVLVDFHLAHEPGDIPAGRGTRRYLAPEQAAGTATAATDVWGLGLTLFEAAAGRLPWDDAPDQASSSASSASAAQSLDELPQRSRPAPPVRQLRALPSPLAQVIDACLEPDPGKRPGLGQVISHLEA